MPTAKKTLTKKSKTNKVATQSNKLTTRSKDISSLSNQLNQAWELYKLNLAGLLKLYLVGLGVTLGLMLGLTLMLAIIYGSWFIITLKLVPTFWLIAVLFILGFAGLIVIGLINLGIQAGYILILDKKGKIDTIAVFRQGLKLAPALLVFSLLQFFFLGSFWMFIIPWILILFLSSFALFEIVLEQKTVVSAVKTSFALVDQFLGVVLGRLILVSLAMSLITATYKITISSLITNDTTGLVGGVAALVQPVLDILVSWFVLSFIYVIYKEIKQKSTQKSASIWWAVVLSIVGWIFFMGISYLIITSLVHHWNSLIDLIQQAITTITS